MPRFIWSNYFRVPAFVVIFLLAYAFSLLFPILSEWSNFRLIVEIVSEVAKGQFENVSHPDFAYALASMIVSVATGIAAALLILDVLWIRFSLWLAGRAILKTDSARSFKQQFSEISDRLSKDPLIGHAWSEYSKTCMRGRDNDPIYAMIRPQAIINVLIARERFFSLKLLPTIPGYFVGVGLLLTFIGLVIALSKAAGGTASDVTDMTASLRQLLDAATFKFSTSIAGLFSSIVLSLFFKLYQIDIEKAFETFCKELESRVFYLAPQFVNYSSWRIGQEQLHHLKEINDVQFFQRFGQVVGPTLKNAVESAMEPLTAKLDSTVNKMDQASRTGIEGMVDRFAESVQSSAGKEL